MIHMAVRVLAVLAITTLPAQADLHLAPGTKIVFGDSSELASAPEPGNEIPAGHGGTGNTVSGTNAYVGGGINNVASGIASTVPGGSGNTASGNYSFAIGRRAKSTAAGAMTIADGTAEDFTNSLENSLRVRATGGLFFFTRLAGEVETFQVNSQGQGFFSDDLIVDGTVFTASDRNKKENFVAVDVESVLHGLVSIPVQRFNFKDKSPSTVRLGVMAQDFYEAFRLGDDPRYIASTDANGVAFASIQALYDMILERDERIDALESTLEAVLSRLDALEADSAR